MRAVALALIALALAVPAAAVDVTPAPPVPREPAKPAAPGQPAPPAANEQSYLAGPAVKASSVPGSILAGPVHPPGPAISSGNWSFVYPFPTPYGPGAFVIQTPYAPYFYCYPYQVGAGVVVNRCVPVLAPPYGWPGYGVGVAPYGCPGWPCPAPPAALSRR